MQISQIFLVFLALTTAAVSQDQPAPKSDATPAAPATQANEASPAPSAPKVPVDAASVTGTTFRSQYFKFTYELPAGWKALDDAVRVKSNRAVLEQDEETARQMAAAAPRKNSSKPGSKPAKPASNLPAVAPVIERYSLMAASPDGLTSLASPTLPRINIWAHRRVPPFDSPMDNVRLAIQGKHSSVLVAPQEVTYYAHTFARVQLIAPGGQYQSRYVITMGDFLIGFDFFTDSERELVEVSDTIKSVRFE